MHEVLVNRLGGLSLPRKSVVRLTDRPDMTLDVYRGRKTTIQQQQQPLSRKYFHIIKGVRATEVLLIFFKPFNSIFFLHIEASGKQSMILFKSALHVLCTYFTSRGTKNGENARKKTARAIKQLPAVLTLK